jgi:hypothetical protein
MLSEEQVQHFRTEGWVALERFWDDDEIAAMRADLDRLRSRADRNVATAGDGSPPPATPQPPARPPRPHSRLFKHMPFAPKPPRPWAT